jgi:hypothetical protein
MREKSSSPDNWEYQGDMNGNKNPIITFSYNLGLLLFKPFPDSLIKNVQLQGGYLFLLRS